MPLTDTSRYFHTDNWKWGFAGKQEWQYW